MDPRDLHPGQYYLLRTFTRLRGAAFAPVADWNREIGYLLGMNQRRCAERGDRFEIFAAFQRLDGHDLIVRHQHESTPFFMQETNRLLSRRIRVRTGVVGGKFSAARYKAFPLHTAEDFWSALIECSVYPLAAGLLRDAKQWRGLSLTPRHVGVHDFRSPEVDLDDLDLVAVPRPRRTENVVVSLPEIVELDRVAYHREYRRRLSDRIDRLERRDDVLGPKKLDRLTLHDPAPQPELDEDCLLAQDDSSFWINHVHISLDPVVDGRVKAARRTFLAEYERTWEDFPVHGWRAFAWAEFPPGTYLWRVRFGAAIRGSPAS